MNKVQKAIYRPKVMWYISQWLQPKYVYITQKILSFASSNNSHLANLPTYMYAFKRTSDDVANWWKLEKH